jgi:hypothetical protein
VISKRPSLTTYHILGLSARGSALALSFLYGLQNAKISIFTNKDTKKGAQRLPVEQKTTSACWSDGKKWTLCRSVESVSSIF